MSQQLFNRMDASSVSHVMAQFNAGDLSVDAACARLGISRAHLYRIRTAWLRDRKGFTPGLSGGDHRAVWPENCVDAIRAMLEAAHDEGRDVNFQVIADELERLHGFSRDRSRVRNFCREHFKVLLAPLPGGHATPLRRWQKAAFGELWQHDSTPRHFVGEPDEVQSMIMTVDDASRLPVGVRICARETLDEHFALFTEEFATYGTPRAIYTDGFTMFGKEGVDMGSQLGRAFRALGIVHLIAPTPQAKGKIERSMRTFQGRLVDALVAAHARTLPEANEVAREHCAWWARHHVNRTTGETPLDRRNRLVADGKIRTLPPPSPLRLRIFLSRLERRRVEDRNHVEFRGEQFTITATLRKHVWLSYRPDSLYVLDDEPDPVRVTLPRILGKFDL